MNGVVVSVNVSAAKGTVKQPLPAATITPWGLAQDAHAGAWHRQVSVLARECIEELGAQCGRAFLPGEFAENITTAGVDLRQAGIRDSLQVGTAELEVTQIGKACHGAGCAIQRTVGKCVMPTEGIFARVRRGGEVRPGDPVRLTRRPLELLVVTLSDRAAQGLYEDRSGPAVEVALRRHFAGTRWLLSVRRALLPDEPAYLRAELQAALGRGTDVIFTTGGTGIGPRDITPETVRPLLDKEIPGIMEVVRTRCAQTVPEAALSRSVAGVIGTTVVYTLPGSERAVQEYLEEILKTLQHALLMLWGIDAHQRAPPG